MRSGEHVVLGTGPLGLAVMDELMKQGKSVKVVNRSGNAPVPENVQCIKCDINNASQVRKLLKNVPVVYHCLGLPYPEWQAFFPKIMKNIIEAASENGTKIVYGDNLYAYGPQQEPIHEGIPYHPIGSKAKVRAQVATALMEADQKGKISATIGRGSDFYGPRALNAMLGERVFLHLLDGKPVELIGNIDTIHSHLFIRDFAKGLTILADEEKANGEIWHIPHAKATSTRQLVEQIARELNKDPKYRVANKFIVKIGGLFSPTMKEFNELLYQQTNDFVVDSNKFKNSFNLNPTSHDKAIKETSEWFLKERS